MKAPRLRAIRKGQSYAAMTRDGTGVFRTPAMSDGAIVDLPSEDLFLPLGEILAALRELSGEDDEIPAKAPRPAKKRRR